MPMEAEPVKIKPAMCLTGDRFDLLAISDALHALNLRMDQVNSGLDNHRSSLGRESVDRIVQGYSMLDHYLSAGVRLLSMGQSRQLLALNHCILFGQENTGSAEFRKALLANETHFYESSGIGELVDWYSRNRERISVWHLAAGIYMRTVESPQLFLEGNHRTGVLLVNHVLARHQKPPLVIDHQLAPLWFDMTEIIRARRHSLLDPGFWLRSLQGELASLIQNHVNICYLRNRSDSGN